MDVVVGERLGTDDAGLTLVERLHHGGFGGKVEHDPGAGDGG